MKDSVLDILHLLAMPLPLNAFYFFTVPYFLCENLLHCEMEPNLIQ